jgi:hypothetical protein
MNEQAARQVVEGLRARGVVARLAHAGPFRVGLRIPLGDGREALWDVDGAAGLEAQVMRDGVLVGFIPKIPDSDRFSPEEMIQAIASADYGPV